MNNFKTTVGLEIHLVIDTKTKMFSSSTSNHMQPVNTNVNFVDLAFPGTLPTVNKNAVVKAICLANAFHMQIEHVLTFDRKNYFYQDLPKGFQITQQFHPIGQNGYLEIKDQNNQIKKINIERIHLEEDTAKQLIIGDKILLDYNRCGMPLIEIVSRPEINSSLEAMNYLVQLKRIVNFLGISDAKMEEGSLRVDVNVSHALYGAKQYGTRVEIKNLNSISNVGKAIEFEKKRQIGLLLLGKNVEQETRRWDDKLNQTIFMRKKTEAVDYHYIVETNILPIELSSSFVNEAIASCPMNVNEALDFLTSLKINEKIIEQLLDDVVLYKIFVQFYQAIKNVDLTITWVLVELIGLAKKNNHSSSQIDPETIQKAIETVVLLVEQKINSKQAKVIYQEIYNSDATPMQIIEKYNFKQIVDPDILEKILKKYFEQNHEMLSQYDARPERVEKYFLGLLMKETHGQANPQIAADVFKKLIKK